MNDQTCELYISVIVHVKQGVMRLNHFSCVSVCH